LIAESYKRGGVNPALVAKELHIAQTSGEQFGAYLCMAECHEGQILRDSSNRKKVDAHRGMACQIGKDEARPPHFAIETVRCAILIAACFSIVITAQDASRGRRDADGTQVRAKNWITAFTQVNKALLDKLLRRYMAFATHALLVFEAAIKGGINGSTKAVLIQGRRTLWKQSVRRK
jgi:hypothetical protein